MAAPRTTCGHRSRPAGRLVACAVAAALAGCSGGAGEPATTTGATGAGSSRTLPPPGGGGAEALLGERCANPSGFSVGYPTDWAVNSGETVAACSRFAPADFDVPAASDARVAATAFSVEAVAFDRVTERRPDEVSREELTVDGHEAVRIERETRTGLYPAGTPITSYVVRLPDGGDGPRTLVADTVGLGDVDHERNVAVLDAQLGSLRFEDGG